MRGSRTEGVALPTTCCAAHHMSRCPPHVALPTTCCAAPGRGPFDVLTVESKNENVRTSEGPGVFHAQSECPVENLCAVMWAV